MHEWLTSGAKCTIRRNKKPQTREKWDSFSENWEKTRQVAQGIRTCLDHTWAPPPPQLPTPPNLDQNFTTPPFGFADWKRVAHVWFGGKVIDHLPLVKYNTTGNGHSSQVRCSWNTATIAVILKNRAAVSLNLKSLFWIAAGISVMYTESICEIQCVQTVFRKTVCFRTTVVL